MKIGKSYQILPAVKGVTRTFTAKDMGIAITMNRPAIALTGCACKTSATAAYPDAARNY